jgi:hypothetical protein
MRQWGHDRKVQICTGTLDRQPERDSLTYHLLGYQFLEATFIHPSPNETTAQTSACSTNVNGDLSYALLCSLTYIRKALQGCSLKFRFGFRFRLP